MLTTTALLATTLLGAAAVTPSPAAADLSVDFTLTSTTVLLPGAYFDVSVTNHGPDPLTSATVVVRFGVNAMATYPMPCALDTATDTLTCTFGALPVGGTATLSSTHPVYLPVHGPPTRFANTATRTASTPADPGSVNDTDTEYCVHTGGGFPPPPIPTLHC